MSTSRIVKPGDTPLHIAARNCSSVDEFITQTKQYSDEQKIEWSITTNNEGKLVLDCINTDLSPTDRNKIFSQVLEFALKNKTSSLTDPVKILSNQKIPLSKELMENLRVGAALALDARKLMPASTTHSQMNGMSWKEFKGIDKILRAGRSQRCFIERQIILSNADFVEEKSQIANTVTISFKVNTNLWVQLKQNDITHLKEIGNCGELSELVAYLGENYQVEMYQYTNQHGDHDFDAIGIEYSATFDVNKPATWGDNAAIIDPHGGFVCPAANYDQFGGDFRTFRYHGKIYNLTTKYNPDFNVIESNPIWKPDTKITYKFTFDVASPLENFLYQLMQPLTPKEKYIFGAVIKPDLKKAIDHNVLTESEVLSWENPTEKLINYFVREDIFLPLLVDKYSGDEELLLEKLQKAISNGADVNYVSANSETALYWSVKRRVLLAVKYLLEAGADPNKPTVKGETPLSLAAKKNDQDIVDLLTPKNPQSENSFYNTVQTLFNSLSLYERSSDVNERKNTSSCEYR